MGMPLVEETVLGELMNERRAVQHLEKVFCGNQDGIEDEIHRGGWLEREQTADG